jgi:hypothetical protein
VLFIVLGVLFAVVLLLWLLAMLGALPNSPTYSPWLAWFSVLFVGVAVFLIGTGAVVVQRVP